MVENFNNVFINDSILQSVDYKVLLDNIMKLDKTIRFSVICDMYGNIVITRHREGLENFLTDQETKDALLYAVEAWRIRHKHEDKIGKGKFAFVEYEKIKRISIPLSNERLLVITIDNSADGLNIIENILNQIKFPKS